MLALDSPDWAHLTACSSGPRALGLLREIVATGQLGTAAAWLSSPVT